MGQACCLFLLEARWLLDPRLTFMPTGWELAWCEKVMKSAVVWNTDLTHDDMRNDFFFENLFLIFLSRKNGLAFMIYTCLSPVTKVGYPPFYSAILKQLTVL